MGLFVYFQGRFECVRCRRMSDACIQTKLLCSQADNSSRPYGVGDSEVLDRLDDYCPLHPWDGRSPLVVVVGDWDCAHCGLNWQWAKAILEVTQVFGRLVATLRELSGFQPGQASELTGVHFVEADLAELSGLWERPPRYNRPEGFLRWQAYPVPERCERVAAGFRSWCREVAGVDITAEPAPAPDRGGG
jgi:hypothetical protein